MLKKEARCLSPRFENRNQILLHFWGKEVYYRILMNIMNEKHYCPQVFSGITGNPRLSGSVFLNNVSILEWTEEPVKRYSSVKKSVETGFGFGNLFFSIKLLSTSFNFCSPINSLKRYITWTVLPGFSISFWYLLPGNIAGNAQKAGGVLHKVYMKERFFANTLQTGKSLSEHYFN